MPNSEIDVAAAAGGRSRGRRSTQCPAGDHPDAQGAGESAEREVDVSAFASWLALRAVEQQSKKLDVLESGKTPVPETGSADARQPETPATQGAAQGTAESPPPVAAAGAEAARARPPVRNVQRPKPARPPLDLPTGIPAALLLVWRPLNLVEIMPGLLHSGTTSGGFSLRTRWLGELTAIEIEHEQTMIAEDKLPCCRSEFITATNSDNAMRRSLAISLSAFQNASSRLTLSYDRQQRSSV